MERPKSHGGQSAGKALHGSGFGGFTTKSNSYTVHYRVQTLGKRSNSEATIWEEGKDMISGEYRGSSTIERFINPSLSVSSWTSAANTPVLGPHYKWRTLNTSQFSP